MAKITLEEAPEFVTLPPDSILDLKVEEVNIREQQGRNGTWHKVEIKFKVLGIQAIGDGSPVENYESMITQHIWGSVPFKLTDSPENKLRQWAEAIFGMELGLGFELDTDLFLNRQVRGITSQYDAKTKDPKTGLPFKRHQIESLLAKNMAGAGAAPATGAPAAAPVAPAPSQADPWGSNWGSDEPPF